MRTLKLILRSLWAVCCYYYMKSHNLPQCPRKLGEWVNGYRPLNQCDLTLCQHEADGKLSGQCVCGTLKKRDDLFV